MVTAIIGHDLYKTTLVADNHTLIADEPASAGGSDLGPAPHQFLLSALASCTAITLRMYADRKKFPLDKIQVDVSSVKTGNVTVFQRSILLEGQLTEEQRQRLLQIAESCPVHRTLTEPIEIKSELTNPPH